MSGGRARLVGAASGLGTLFAGCVVGLVTMMFGAVIGVDVLGTRVHYELWANPDARVGGRVGFAAGALLVALAGAALRRLLGNRASLLALTAVPLLGLAAAAGVTLSPVGGGLVAFSPLLAQVLAALVTTALAGAALVGPPREEGPS